MLHVAQVKLSQRGASQFGQPIGDGVLFARYPPGVQLVMAPLTAHPSPQLCILITQTIGQHTTLKEPRATVLIPWLDVEPDAVLPGHGRLADVMAGLSADGVRRRDDLRLEW